LILFSLKREPVLNNDKNITMALTFWQLPDSIKGLIYDYDDTYQKTMKNEVLVDLWKAKWIKWRNGLSSLSSKAVADHLLNVWGVWNDSPYGEPCNLYWFKKHYFPEDFRIVTSYTSVRGISVKVFSTNSCVFEGWVLRDSQQKDMVWLENREVENMIDIHWDMKNGLYVWQKLYS
jgi:hypothetical protein